MHLMKSNTIIYFSCLTQDSTVHYPHGISLSQKKMASFLCWRNAPHMHSDHYSCKN